MKCYGFLVFFKLEIVIQGNLISQVKTIILSNGFHNYAKKIEVPN